MYKICKVGLHSVSGSCMHIELEYTLQHVLHKSSLCSADLSERTSLVVGSTSGVACLAVATLRACTLEHSPAICSGSFAAFI